MYTTASHLSLLRGKLLHPVYIKPVSIWPLPSFVLCSLLAPWSRVLEKLAGFQLVEKFPAFYGTRNFITAFTSAHHMSLSWASSIQSSSPHPISCIPILILSSHLRLRLPNGLFPSGLVLFRPKNCTNFSSPPWVTYVRPISLFLTSSSYYLLHGL